MKSLKVCTILALLLLITTELALFCYLLYCSTPSIVTKLDTDYISTTIAEKYVYNNHSESCVASYNREICNSNINDLTCIKYVFYATGSANITCKIENGTKMIFEQDVHIDDKNKSIEIFISNTNSTFEKINNIIKFNDTLGLMCSNLYNEYNFTNFCSTFNILLNDTEATTKQYIIKEYAELPKFVGPLMGIVAIGILILFTIITILFIV